MSEQLKEKQKHALGMTTSLQNNFDVLGTDSTRCWNWAGTVVENTNTQLKNVPSLWYKSNRTPWDMRLSENNQQRGGVRQRDVKRYWEQPHSLQAASHHRVVDGFLQRYTRLVFLLT